jgi:hypothetical protein
MVDTPTGYRFLLGTDGDTGLIHDGRSTYTQLIPGRPTLGGPLPPTLPKCDIRVELQALPVEFRWRVDGVGTTTNAQGLAESLTHAYAKNRTDTAVVHVQPAHPAQLAYWGVDGAASTLYPLRVLSPSGADMEELQLLVRGPYAVFQTRLFSRAITDPEIWARLVAGCSGGIHWLPTPPTSVPSLWPASSFVQPGLAMDLLPTRAREAEAARAKAPSAPEQREAAAERLRMLLAGGEAAGTPVEPEQLVVYDQFLTDTLEGTPLLDSARTWLGDVTNAHDLRGLIRMLLTALDS